MNFVGIRLSITVYAFMYAYSNCVNTILEWTVNFRSSQSICMSIKEIFVIFIKTWKKCTIGSN